MAFSLNKIQLIGVIGRDAETRFTTNNTGVTSFSIATTHSYKGKDGNYVNDTTWHNITAFSLSDYMKDALKKGKKVYVEGRLSKRDHTDKEGNKKQAVEVILESIIPLEGRESGSSSGRDERFPSTTPEGIGDVNEEQDLPF